MFFLMTSIVKIRGKIKEQVTHFSVQHEIQTFSGMVFA